MKHLRILVWTLVFCAVVSGSVLSSGCSKASEETSTQKESDQKGQADAFRAQQAAGKPAAK